MDVSHNFDAPIAHAYRGHVMFLKFDWRRPNDQSPVAAELEGPWPDYPAALDDAMAAAERWIDSQLP